MIHLEHNVSSPRKRAGRFTLSHWSAVNALALIVLWCCHHFIGEHSYPTLVLLALPQHIFALPTLLLLVGAARKRRWRWFGANLVVAIIFLFVLLGWHWALPSKESGPTLRVMTFNVDAASKAADNAVEAIERENPDIACLQEVESWQGSPDPLPEIRRRLPGWRIVSQGELVTLTRLPLVSHDVWPYSEDLGDGVLETVVNWQGRNIHILTLHVGRPLAGAIGWQVPPVGRRAARREMQTAALRQASRFQQGPLIICGDFNMQPHGLIYQSLTALFTDAFAQAGRGFGFTYPASLPMLRIDHFFTNRDLTARRCYVGPRFSSDHCPLIAEFEFQREAK